MVPMTMEAIDIDSNACDNAVFYFTGDVIISGEMKALGAGIFREIHAVSENGSLNFDLTLSGDTPF